MSVGGATWDTAGTLTLGSDNTFDPDDATVDADGVYDQAWWKFTPSALTRVTLTAGPYGFLRVYTGASFAGKASVASVSGEPAMATFDVHPGVEHHVLFGRGQFDPPPDNYIVIYERTTLVATGWFNDLQDAEDNILIVSDGALVDENPNPGFSSAFMPAWAEDVIRDGQARSATYTITEVLGGDELDSVAMDCAIAHANNGDNGNQVWNGTGSGTDTGEGVCRPLFIGEAEEGASRTSTRFQRDDRPGDPDILLAGQVEAEMNGPSYGLWYLPVRDNLNPWGTLFGEALDVLDPTTHGLPANSVVEWEGPHVELVRIELADADPVSEGEVELLNLSNQWAVNSNIGPTWEVGFTTPWQRGEFPGVLYDLRWDYHDGDTVWAELPDSEGWDGHDWVEEYEGDADVPLAADDVVICWPLRGALSTSDTWTRNARIAVKFVLRAPRFRFLYEGSPVVRQYPRDDTRGVSSAPRLWPRSKSHRIAGGYPGGSGA